MMFNVCNYLVKQFQPTNVTLPFYGNYFIAFSRFYAPIHEVLVMVIIILGLISNVSLMAVLTRKDMSSPTNIFLIGISVADCSVLMTYFCIWLPLVKYKVGSYEFAHALATMLPPYAIYRSVSSLLTVLLASWRVMRLYLPFQSRINLSESSAIKGTLICFGLCQVLFIPSTYSYGVTHSNCTLSNGTNKIIYYVC